MLWEIKNKIEYELKAYLAKLDNLYCLSALSPVIFNSIREFVLRDGKRIRPCLFILGYRGFSEGNPAGLYTTAVSLEFLHDFMLVHDDIIDKAAMRRGKPSMHTMLNKYLRRHKNIKFDGNDLAIIIGDIMYAFSIHSFLSIKEDPRRKETALKKLIDAAIYTGGGEFVELLAGMTDMSKVTKNAIYKIYDFKTANYTFASPLAIGAILAGAKKSQVNRLFECGIYLGRAFQIKDDIIGLFGRESHIGKPNLTDIREAKKTLLVWYAYNNSNMKNKSRIQIILSKINAGRNELTAMRKILKDTGALDYAKEEVDSCLNKAMSVLLSIKMRSKYKTLLVRYSQELLTL